MRSSKTPWWLIRAAHLKRKLRRSIITRLIGKRIMDQDLWHFRRNSVARGWLLGSIVASTPLIGLHTVMAMPIAILVRANMAVVVAWAMFTNPLIAPFVYPPMYWVGTKLTGRHSRGLNFNDMTLRRALDMLYHDGLTLMVGCLVVGIAIGLIGYGLILWLWPEKKLRGA
jgi:uncharacterized protein (DUF2062 family)